MKKSKAEIKEFIEEIGVYFEQTKELSPLAARIYVGLIIYPKRGYSFDELVEMSECSKSSVSTNINLLLKTNILEYYTKPGERKRYFRLSKNHLEITLEGYRVRINKELELLKKISSFKAENDEEVDLKSKAFEKLYRNYLQAEQKNLEAIIHKMNQLEEQFKKVP